MKYEVIDNFLDEEYFDSLVTLFTDKDKRGNFNMPWFFQSSISGDNVVEDNLFYMVHQFYNNHVPRSNFFNNIFFIHLNKYLIDCQKIYLFYLII